MKEIILSKGKALVDDVDFPRLSQWKWSTTSSGYAARRARRGREKPLYILMHRMILGVTDPEIQIDHINHDKLDNRRENLRLVTNRQNQANKRKRHSSKFVGVSWTKSRSQWRACIFLNGRNKHLGWFDQESQAAQAYDEALHAL